VLQGWDTAMQQEPQSLVIELLAMSKIYFEGLEVLELGDVERFQVLFIDLI